MNPKQRNNLQICAEIFASVALSVALYAGYLNIFNQQPKENNPFYKRKVTKKVHLSYQNNPLIHDGEAFYFEDKARELHIHSGNDPFCFGFMIDYNNDGKVEVYGYKIGANARKVFFERPSNLDSNSMFLRKDATLKRVFNSLEKITSGESR